MSILNLNTIRMAFVSAAMFALSFLFISSVCYAGFTVRTSTIEVKCGKTFLGAPLFERKGNSFIQLKVTMEGIKEAGIDEIIETKEVDIGNDEKGIRMQGGSGLCVHIAATCITYRDREDISVTGNSHSCREGEGIEVKMLEPNSKDPDEFHAVLTLTETINDDINKSVSELCENAIDVIEGIIAGVENTTTVEKSEYKVDKKVLPISKKSGCSIL